MSSQSNITNYFNTRKRIRCDNVKSRTKILILEAEKSMQKFIKTESSQTTQVIYRESTEIDVQAPASSSVTRTEKPKSVKKVSVSSKKKKNCVDNKGNDKLKQCLLTDFARSNTKSPTPSTSSSQDEQTTSSESTEEVTDIPLVQHMSPDKPSVSRTLDFDGSPAKTLLTNAKDMSLDDIRARLRTKGSKVEALKASLSRFSKLDVELKQVTAKEEALKLKPFDKIEVTVPVSPKKSIPYSSPRKAEPEILPSLVLSPSKALGSRLALWQQHRALAESRAPVLPLPYRLRQLDERFHAVDVISSMMINRGEDVTFEKLKPGVEEITRLNFTKHHLGQIVQLYPSAFSLRQEKRKTFTLTGRPDVYDLLISPNYELNTEGEKARVLPAVLQARRKSFHKLLIERVMDCHEVYLQHLDPPMIVARNKLTRWHPGFDAEQVPDIPSAVLPQPPNQDKLSTAREVLDHAQQMLSCNSRLSQALLKATKESETSKTMDGDNAPLNPAFKGIPTSLLEKIRAKQAAKALEAMTRTPAQDTRKARLSRLPELTRELRNVFLVEKKGVLSSDVLLEKMANSYPHEMTADEMTKHLELLSEEEPLLLQRISMRQTVFYKLDRKINMSEVMARLERHLFNST